LNFNFDNFEFTKTIEKKDLPTYEETQEKEPTVLVERPIIVSNRFFSESQQYTCQNCQANVMTKTIKKSGLVNWFCFTSNKSN
jgi:hypothetical protein